MPNYLAVFQNNMLATAQNRYVAKELMELSDKTEEYGIVLSGRDCQEIAEFRVAQVAGRAQQAGFPLRCTMEKE